jgi:hypothetical protein
MIRRQNDTHYVDYLQVALTEGFPDGDRLNNHRSALINRVKRNNGNAVTDRWDSILIKDVWCLSYHNDFCSRYDADAYRIDFTEAFDDEDSRISIIIEEDGA